MTTVLILENAALLSSDLHHFQNEICCHLYLCSSILYILFLWLLLRFFFLTILVNLVIICLYIVSLMSCAASLWSFMDMSVLIKLWSKFRNFHLSFLKLFFLWSNTLSLLSRTLITHILSHFKLSHSSLILYSLFLSFFSRKLFISDSFYQCVGFINLFFWTS